MKPVMNNNEKYKLSIVKKIAAALLAICLIVGIGVLLVGCNNDDPVDQNPGIEQPADPDDGKEDPDDGKEDPENPGGDIEEPTDPDDGKEDPENPGEPTDPENPGDPTDPENPGEPTDPENPGGEPTDPEEPENPDPSVPITPIEPGEIAPPQSIDMIFPDIDTNGELTEAEKKILEISQGYQEKIEASLDEYLYETIALFTNSMTEDKISNVAWRLVADENDSSKVGKITISFDYNNTDTNQVFYVRSVVPQNDLTFAELYQGDSTILESAFESSRFGGAKYTTDFSFAHDPSIQESSAALTEALKNVAINDKDLEIEVDENTEYYIVDRGTQLDNILGEARSVELFIKTDNGYQKITYMLGEPTFDIETLLQEINQGSYRKVLTEKGAFTGNQISVSDKETVASIASETYRLYGKMKAKDGSSVNIYLPQNIVNAK